MRHLMPALLLILLALAPSDAAAAKWAGCPAAPNLAYPSQLGATSSPFVHPNHELRVLLNDAEVAASGGFSMLDENVVRIRFEPVFGVPVVLERLRVAAASSAVLSFAFPDPAEEVGRPLTGPVEVTVKRDGRTVARIDSWDLVALPPATDVTELLLREDRRQAIPAALGADGDLWVPASFHGKPMPMDGCPGDLMMPIAVEVGAATIPGVTTSGRGPLDQIRSLALYLGEVSLDGHSFYGVMWHERIPLVHVGGSRGVSLCRMNDALDVVIRVKGKASWTRDGSPLAGVARDGAAIPLVLEGARRKNHAEVPPQDTFGNLCELDLAASNSR